mmetsp:Transcript_51410/g.159410  ORF Transcript_51410/g.159410 Transcript_51410/m.159410 type:complete len:208 (+) Transcript_51410:567-1190(+)
MYFSTRGSTMSFGLFWSFIQGITNSTLEGRASSAALMCPGPYPLLASLVINSRILLDIALPGGSCPMPISVGLAQYSFDFWHMLQVSSCTRRRPMFLRASSFEAVLASEKSIHFGSPSQVDGPSKNRDVISSETLSPLPESAAAWSMASIIPVCQAPTLISRKFAMPFSMNALTAVLMPSTSFASKPSAPKMSTPIELVSCPTTSAA